MKLHISTPHIKAVTVQHEFKGCPWLTEQKPSCVSILFLYLTHPRQECESHFIRGGGGRKAVWSSCEGALSVRTCAPRGCFVGAVLWCRMGKSCVSLCSRFVRVSVLILRCCTPECLYISCAKTWQPCNCFTVMLLLFLLQPCKDDH